jgi:hypothetical protein
MDTTNTNSVEGDEIAYDVTMKIALIGDSCTFQISFEL